MLRRVRPIASTSSGWKPRPSASASSGSRHARPRLVTPTTLEDAPRPVEDRELGSDDPDRPAAARRARPGRHRSCGTTARLEELRHEALTRPSSRGISLFFERPSWDEYFMSIARVVASRSNCVKRKVAAVITKDRRIISTGYNGTPRGTSATATRAAARAATASPRAARASTSASAPTARRTPSSQASYHGVSVRGATIYTTLCPCLSARR